MGDIEGNDISKSDSLYFIAKQGIMEEYLRDEIYCQILNQLFNNENQFFLFFIIFIYLCI